MRKSLRSHALKAALARSLGTGLLLAALLALGGTSASAQDRAVVSNEIAVSGNDAALALFFADDGSLEIAFRDGTVFIDGEDVGSYEPGDDLDRSWRSLLGQAVALSDGPLAEALMDWSPPGNDQGLGRDVDVAIERALSVPTQDVATAPDVDVTVSADLDLDLLGSLLGRTERFIALAEALEDLDLEFDDLNSEQVHVHLGEDVVIEAGEMLEASLILIDSDLDVQGHLAGNAILLGGSLEVGEDAHVDGEIHLSETRVVSEGGVVEGGINRLRLEREVVDGQRFDELRDEIRNEIRDELRSEFRGSTDRGRDRSRSDGVFGALRHVSRGIGGMMENLFTFAFIALMAFAVVRFFPGNLEVVSEAARANPTRAGVVGVAGAFLLFPVWILGIVGLCISLIGIPVLLAWIPLFPVAALLAGGLGFLAVAGNVGEWAAKQNIQGFDWVRPSNPLSVILAGVAALILPFFAANFIQMAGPWFGFVRGLLAFVGSVGVLVAMSVGFGAVLLTRGGRRREWETGSDDLDLDASTWDEEFRSATATVDVEVEEVVTEEEAAPTAEKTDTTSEAGAEEPEGDDATENGDDEEPKDG